ncbi:MAG: hypothetical protein JNK29_13255 [Anaerolineales bacterium]|nr:hypothetical protein [Anaerolineales bacterium]
MRRMTLAQQFVPLSLILLGLSLAGLGGWAGSQIRAGLITRAAGAAALYVSGLLSPPLPELAAGAPLTTEHIQALQRLVGPTPFGQNIVAFKVWDPGGQVIHSTNPALVGRIFPVKDELARAFRGEIVCDVSDLEDTANFLERGQWPQLLEVYNPVLDPQTGQVTAVIELYQTVEALEQEARQAQTANWLVFGGVMGGVFLALAGLVGRGSRAAVQQGDQLHHHVSALDQRLSLAEERLAHARRGAARLVLAYEGAPQPAGRPALPANLAALPLAEVLRQAAAAAPASVNQPVSVTAAGLPAQVPPALKIMLYRYVQAALPLIGSAAGLAGGWMRAEAEDGLLRVELGAGHTEASGPAQPGSWTELRPWVEAAGGSLTAWQGPGQAARVSAEWPLTEGDTVWW